VGFAVLFAERSIAMVIHESSPTPASFNAVDEHGFTPKPTPAPMLERLGMLAEQHLFGRQESQATCAYINGASQAPFVCYAGAACNFFSSPNYLACCSTDDNGSILSAAPGCAPASACIPYEDNAVAYEEAITSNNIVYWYVSSTKDTYGRS
jgi:hypothetical protein